MMAGTLAIAACAEAGGGSPSQPIGTVSEAAWKRITDGLDSLLDQLEGLVEYPPGAAVVVVTARFAAGMGAPRADDGNQAGDDRAEQRQENDG